MQARLLPIGDDDVARVAQFLHEHLNPLPVTAWAQVMSPPWEADGPNRGFLLEEEGEVLGAYLAIYSRRILEGREVNVCNLAAFCILPEHRSQALRLTRALLGQRGYTFTDLSPSGNVVALNERLGLRHLDATTWLAPNLPAPIRRGVRVSGEPAILEAGLEGESLQLFRDHRHAPAARQLLVSSGAAWAHLVYRRERRMGHRRFASALHAGGDLDLLRGAWGQVAGVLLRQGLPLTLAEPRVLGFRPRPAWKLSAPRAKMLKSREISDVDHLYSELALLEW